MEFLFQETLIAFDEKRECFKENSSLESLRKSPKPLDAIEILPSASGLPSNFPVVINGFNSTMFEAQTV